MLQAEDCNTDTRHLMLNLQLKYPYPQTLFRQLSRYSTDSFNFSKMHLRVFNSGPLCFSLLLSAISTIIGGGTRVAAFTVQLIGFPDILLRNKFVFLGILYYSRPATCR